MTSTPAKFNFDLDLSGNQQRTRVMTEARIAELRQIAHDEGFAEGLAQGERTEVARAAAQLTVAGQKIAQSATTLLQSVAATDRQARSDGIGLARAVGLKLAAALVSRMPEADLDALIEECLASLDRAPHLVIRCHPALADKLKDITEAHMSAAGYSGRLIVLGDGAIPPGDGRLEWADGGLVRDMSAILTRIDASIAAYCATSGLPAPILTPNPLAETEHE